MRKREVTYEYVRSVLDYNPGTGIFRWRRSSGNSFYVGAVAWTVAGSKTKDGYVRIQINGKAYAAHRLALLYMNGEMPNEGVDHINGDRSDNSFSNLRLASSSMNALNRTSSRNKTGFEGVRFRPSCRNKPYIAAISFNGKKKSFSAATPQEAHAWYLATRATALACDVTRSKSHLKEKPTLTHALLLERLSYDPVSGRFYHNINCGRGTRTRKIGDLAGSIGSSGYYAISLYGRSYKQHRLAWYFVTGSWPKDRIDHIDGNKLNNAFSNLREATASENSQNIRRAKIMNKHGFTGVSFNKKCVNRPFAARIILNGKSRSVSARTAAEASLYYNIMAEAFFGEYAPT